MELACFFCPIYGEDLKAESPEDMVTHNLITVYLVSSQRRFDYALEHENEAEGSSKPEIPAQATRATRFYY